MFTKEYLGENVLGLKKGREYVIFQKRKSSNKDIHLTSGIFIGESGVNNDFYIFQSDNYRECFLKVDFLIKEYGIKEISKK